MRAVGVLETRDWRLEAGGFGEVGDKGLDRKARAPAVSKMELLVGGIVAGASRRLEDPMIITRLRRQKLFLQS